jgi:hypothetical protein
MNNYLIPLDIINIKANADKNQTSMLNADFATLKKWTKEKRTSWFIPITVTNLNGKQVPLKLKFNRQVLSSNAKHSSSVEENKANDVRIAFKKITEDDLKNTDYKSNGHTAIMESNEEFIKALDIIAEEFISFSNQLFTPGNSINASCKTHKIALPDKKINCFRQVDRKNESDPNEKILLETPIYRIKIPADPKTKKLGFNTEKNGHVYIIYDTKKSAQLAEKNKSKVGELVVAKININGVETDLNVNNAKHFITYMSLTNGIIEFDSICVSSVGLSMTCRIKELHVWRHKPRAMENTVVDLQDTAYFAPSNSLEDDEDDVIIDEPNNASPNSSKANNSSKNVQKSSKFNSKVLENDDNEEELDLHSEVDEPDSNDDSDEEVVSKVVEPNSDDSDEEGTPVTPPVKSKPKSKSSKSKK